MRAVIIGLQSDIGRNIAGRLKLADWEVDGTTRLSCNLEDRASVEEAINRIAYSWDLLLFAAGTMEPIAPFFTTNAEDWERCLTVNVFAPLRILRGLVPLAKPGASVVFFAGPNLTKPSPTYTAYRSSKALLADLVGQLHHESPKIKFLLLAPGVVKTKIHGQTLKAGKHAANYGRAWAIMHDKESSTPMQAIHECLLWALGEPREAVGGRTIHVVNDPWRGGPLRT
jgi:NAD(P)-dependent dehydrogenase (short-subunit alcohol dehydrogenase family)